MRGNGCGHDDLCVRRKLTPDCRNELRLMRGLRQSESRQKDSQENDKAAHRNRQLDDKSPEKPAVLDIEMAITPPDYPYGCQCAGSGGQIRQGIHLICSRMQWLCRIRDAPSRHSKAWRDLSHSLGFSGKRRSPQELGNFAARSKATACSIPR
jgi:hypothetical protein